MKRIVLVMLFGVLISGALFCMQGDNDNPAERGRQHDGNISEIAGQVVV